MVLLVGRTRLAFVVSVLAATACSQIQIHVDETTAARMDWEEHRVRASRARGDTRQEGLAQAAREAAEAYCTDRGRTAEIWEEETVVAGGGQIPNITVHGVYGRRRLEPYAIHSGLFRCRSSDGHEDAPAAAPSCELPVTESPLWLALIPQRSELRVFFDVNTWLDVPVEFPLESGHRELHPVDGAFMWAGTEHDAFELIAGSPPDRRYAALSGTVAVEASPTVATVRLDDVVLLSKPDTGHARCVAQIEAVTFEVPVLPWWELPGCHTDLSWEDPKFPWWVEPGEEPDTVIFTTSFSDPQRQLVVAGPLSAGTYRLGTPAAPSFTAEHEDRTLHAVDGLVTIRTDYGGVHADIKQLIAVSTDDAPCVEIVQHISIRGKQRER